ncbi:MAG: methylmalonyl-CoA mutase family protein [Bdellovibrio sp.]|nr:methylmalonyl-CoA mutase family protein [Bdellovibrio sp.]
MSNLRFVTAASLFDGHDVSINIMRRILQSQGVEVIHLGHNRSVDEIVGAAIQEDAHAVAVSSYQGGHIQYFSFLRKCLNDNGGKNIRIFGGGGGVITTDEVRYLHEIGITKIYTPADGVSLGLDGIVKDMISQSDYSTIESYSCHSFLSTMDHMLLGKAISYIEAKGALQFHVEEKNIQVLGLTGTGGAGKSSLIDELISRFHLYYPQMKIALISVDPTRKKTGGALLGDRIRLSSVSNKNLFVRSLATRQSSDELSPQIKQVISYLKALDFDLIIVESSGIGQASDAITKVATQSVYVMTPEFGAPSQLEKIEMLDAADYIVINKYERPRSEDALRDVRKQYRRNKNLLGTGKGFVRDEELPIYGTVASRFNDDGVNALFCDLILGLGLDNSTVKGLKKSKASTSVAPIIRHERVNYLWDVVQAVRDYNNKTKEIVSLIADFEACERAVELTKSKEVEKYCKLLCAKIDSEIFKQIKCYEENTEKLKSGEFLYSVRGKEIKVQSKYTSLSGLNISKVAIPTISSKAQIVQFLRESNLPGHFPYSAGIYPFKRTDEDAKRMFAGEGGPIRTNKRFHFLSKNDQAKRLSTAFDSVTLYGQDPDTRLDIFGKIGEAGVSIATLDDMDDLYRGFDLTAPQTSVSMTINGPAAIILAMFFNVAIKNKLTDHDFWNTEKRLEIMRQVRGTVQADILKEDQAQNTCIFSLDFALKMMGDVQEYFCKNKIRNYYTVSISGYHIAEAGANPISQVAFTLANGFTYVEYYLSRGMKIDDFAENLSFFFSNGLDPEYTVIGSVARKIWAIALRDRYGANDKSQKLKYHIQTSGRSLHAQEINFNDIRTTLQAFLALSDNCNSLHTNAYDEAITTPTEESVRRAIAIQLIINKEFGFNKTDNPLQGSYIFNELCQLVEEAILSEFERISARGGVLGAMEAMYQRSKIQEESLFYEMQKDSGEFPIVGVNTYLATRANEHFDTPIQLSRCTDQEKNDQIDRLKKFHNKNEDKAKNALAKLREVALNGGNIFEEMLTTVNYCSLGQITEVLYSVGGSYRRNM